MKPIKPDKSVNSIVQKIRTKKRRCKEIENVIYNVYNKKALLLKKKLQKELKELKLEVTGTSNGTVYISIKNDNDFFSIGYYKFEKEKINCNYYEYGIKLVTSNGKSSKFIKLANTNAAPQSFDTDLIIEQIIEFLDDNLNLIEIGDL